MLDFFHRLLLRIISKECLLERNDWDGLLGFDLTDVQLSVSQFMEKTWFRTKSMRAEQGRNKVDKEKNENARTDVIARAVMGDMFNPHVDEGRAYLRYVCKELLKHPIFLSDFVVGLASFDYSVLFKLPRCQAADCYIAVYFKIFVFVGG